MLLVKHFYISTFNSSQKFLIVFSAVVAFVAFFWFCPNIKDTYRTKDIKNILSTDYLEAARNYLLLQVGWSGSKSDVVVGDGFLYLGEGHTRSVSQYFNLDKNFYVSSGDGVRHLKRLKNLLNVPVVAYSIPAKASVYPEFLPFFGAMEEPPFRAAYEATLESSLFTTNREQLFDNKDIGYLYNPWGSHWNMAGAYLGYKWLVEQINKQSLDPIVSLKEIDFEYHEGPYVDDSLAEGLLKLRNLPFYSSLVPEETYIPLPKNEVGGKIFVTKLHNKKFSLFGEKEESENFSIGVNGQSVLVQSKKPLNDLTVLWLRDSFGTAMSQYMHKTFASVYQVHPKFIKSPRQMRRLIALSKPDLVVYSLAERQAARLIDFTAPDLVKGAELYLHGDTECSSEYSLSEIVGVKYKRVKVVEQDHRYVSRHPDPMIILPDASEIVCGQVTISGKLILPRGSTFEVFYAKRGKAFIRSQSIRVSLRAGANVIDVTVPKGYQRIRIDPVTGKGRFRTLDLKIKGARFSD